MRKSFIICVSSRISYRLRAHGIIELLAASFAVASGNDAFGQSLVRTHVDDFGVTGYGFAVAPLGDVTGDGVGDYAVSNDAAEFYGFPNVTVYDGLSGFSIQHIASPLPPSSYSGFGASMDGGADLDNDGSPEMLIGSPDGSLGVGGAVYVATAVSGNFVRAHFSSSIDDSFGKEARFLGDLNLDGFVDYGVGDNPQSGHSSVHVFDGRLGAAIATLTPPPAPPQAFTFFSYRIRSLADGNGDGIPEFTVTAPNVDVSGVINAGALYIYSGATQALIRSIFGAAASDILGFGCADLGDMDGDGASEIAAKVASDIAIYSSATGLEVKRIKAFKPKYPLGFLLSATDDADGDGFKDLLASEWVFAPPMYTAKAVVFSSGSKKRLYEIECPVPSDGTGSASSHFPNALGYIGDIDKDGRGELLISTFEIPGGAAQVYSREPLYSIDEQVSPADPIASMDISAGIANAGRNYFILSSYTGTAGIPIGAATLPLTFDVLTELGIYYVNTPIFDQFAGVLDSNGMAYAMFDAAAVPAAAQGFTFYFAYVVYGGTGPFVASNAHSVYLNPLGL